jgi:16S rRNA processing protein RimM
MNSLGGLQKSWKISGILGFDVFSCSGEYLGVLFDVIATGSNDVWVVRFDEHEILIPALKTIIKEVSVLSKRIFVSLPKEFEQIYGCVSWADGEVFDNSLIYED